MFCSRQTFYNLFSPIFLSWRKNNGLSNWSQYLCVYNVYRYTHIHVSRHMCMSVPTQHCSKPIIVNRIKKRTYEAKIIRCLFPCCVNQRSERVHWKREVVKDSQEPKPLKEGRVEVTVAQVECNPGDQVTRFSHYSYFS